MNQHDYGMRTPEGARLVNHLVAHLTRHEDLHPGCKVSILDQICAEIAHRGHPEVHDVEIQTLIKEAIQL